MAAKVEVVGLVRTVGKTVTTPLVTIPGIGTGVAYTSGDAFGAKFEVPVPLSGIIYTAIFIDKDDEGVETDLVLFTEDFTATADNDAFAVTDADIQSLLSTITFATFKNFSVNQVSSVGIVGVAYVAPLRKLFAQCVTRGVPNIAANNIPQVRLTILSDE